MKSESACRACFGVTGQSKLSRLPGCFFELQIDQRDHFLRDRIGAKTLWLGYLAGASLTERTSICRVVIPLTAFGFAAVHQDVVLATQLTVEILQTKLFAALGVLCEFFRRAQKMTVWPEF